MLVADDSPVVRAALRKALAAAGFAALEAGSVEEACTVDASRLFAAVLDLDLGDGTGLDVAKALSAVRPSLPYVFFSSGDDPLLTAAARSQAHVFIKPRELDRVVAWLQAL
ncbi:response regulator [Pendulispora brunnea]|uniref:Response regulator n=1 Tax=Pendulispora brunnea TaxID=2905690 RepID=A0ABZ2KT67_9BACT